MSLNFDREIENVRNFVYLIFFHLRLTHSMGKKTGTIEIEHGNSQVSTISKSKSGNLVVVRIHKTTEKLENQKNYISFISFADYSSIDFESI